MAEHGVAVLVTRDDWHLRSGPTPAPVPSPLIEPLNDESLGRVRDGTFSRRAPAVDERVIDRLESALRGQ
jgi:hypothetical protein